MMRFCTIIFIALILLIPAYLFSADITVNVETREAEPGESIYLRLLLESDIEISGLRIPITMENPWITLDSVSWEYTAAIEGFNNQTFLSDANRSAVINVLPKTQTPIPRIAVPGGELCRLCITVNPMAPTDFIVVDTFHAAFTWLDASDPLGNSYKPDFIVGGIQVSDDYTGSDDNEYPLPASFELEQNYPNPFNPTTQISFSLPQTSNITLTVYNILGREVTVLTQGGCSAGRHLVEWVAADHPSGIYFYRLEGEGFSSTRRMLLLK